MKKLNSLRRATVLVLLVAGLTPAILPAAQSHATGMPAAHALDDATIFAIFDEVNSVDIWTARLGAKKCHSPEVCELARSVAGDHEQVQQMMRDLTRKLMITPVPPDSDSNAQDHAKAITLLQGKSGAEFDRAYLLHEIEFHKAAINAIKQALLPEIQDQEFRALVQNVLPGLEHHLNETTQLAHKLGYE
jgi:putative membrane protein